MKSARRGYGPAGQPGAVGGPEPRELGNSPAPGRYSRPMSEAKPDPSGSTGEFRAFVEKGGADSARRGGLRNPAVIVTVVLAVLLVIAVIALGVG